MPGGIRPDLVIVFARKYAEAEALAICEAIRGCREMDGIPLLAAISMYQMPLGNDVKRLPGADIVFTPLKAAEVSGSIGRME